MYMNVPIQFLYTDNLVQRKFRNYITEYFTNNNLLMNELQKLDYSGTFFFLLKQRNNYVVEC